MVASVDLAGARYRDPPHRFEAGTSNIAGIIGLGAAIRYVRALDVAADEARVHARLVDAIRDAGARIVGSPELAVVSFDLPGVHPHDVATIIDGEGVAVRSGHHCAEPLHRRFGLAATLPRVDRLLFRRRRRRPARTRLALGARGVPMSTRDLYQALIVEHDRHPHNEGPLPGATHEATIDNPMCGDVVTVRMIVDGDVVREVAFEGKGCALSRAAASLMTDRVRGARVDMLRPLAAQIEALVHAEPETPDRR